MVVTWNSVLLIDPMVGGKRVKEYFQIVYDYRKQTWVFNYAKGMAGYETFIGYRINGTEMVGDIFAEQLSLADYTVKLDAVVVPKPPVIPPPHNPMGPVEPKPKPKPPWTPKTWQTVYEDNTTRLQKLR